jgi:hypothetical protein
MKDHLKELEKLQHMVYKDLKRQEANLKEITSIIPEYLKLAENILPGLDEDFEVTPADLY